MKLWIDDIRPAPGDWYRAKSSAQAIEFLIRYRGKITHISFDHDLGMTALNEVDDAYRVVCWLEEMVYLDNYPIPDVLDCHSDNGPGIIRIRQVIDSIFRRPK